jgi:hypothetical protein
VSLSLVGEYDGFMHVRAALAFLGIMLISATPPAAARGQPLRPAGAESLLAEEPSVQEDAPDPSLGTPSQAVDLVLHWVTASGDNNGLPFIVIDKLGARIFVFDPQGQPLGAAPALIGITRGDDSAPGIGSRSLDKIPVEQRTTPAGRFISRFGPAQGHAPVLWVDYADAISLHPVVTANKDERRLQRIKSASAEDHRISFGCINVPASFYAKVVKPLFKARSSSGVVYILPDTKSLAEVFPGIMLQAQAIPPSQAMDTTVRAQR